MEERENSARATQAQTVTFQPRLLNEHLVCILCFGYFRDAQTIKECLHTFCRSCIFRYFEEHEDCPNCGRDLRPDPYILIRDDATIQRIIEKVFPEVVEQDQKAEAQFYEERGLASPTQHDDKMDVEEPIVD